MSTIDSILGVPGLVVQSVKRAQDIHVWARPRRHPACLYCAAQPVRIKATHERTLKHTRQGNQLMVLHLVVPKYHCTQCNRYSVTGLLALARADALPRRIVWRCLKPMKEE